MPASSVLLLDTDSASAALITGTLTGAGYAITVVADADEAFRRAVDHNLVIIDIVGQGRSAEAICREIRSTPSLARIPVLCISQSDEVEARVQFLESGADDVIVKPFDSRELEARVEALLLRFQRSKDLAPIVADGVLQVRRRRTIAVFSPKGGVGATTIAVNIASSLAEQTRERTAIVDLDLQFGQVATHLNINPRQTLAQVVRDEQALHDPDLLRSYAERHETGLYVFAAPPGPELADLFGVSQIQALLTTVAGAYNNVVVDAGSSLNEGILAALEWAEAVILPVIPEISALKALHSLIDYLGEIGTVGVKASFVVNHIFAREMLRLRDVESALGARTAIELPYDPILYLKAVNEGIPAVRGAAKTPVAEAFGRLAGIAVGEDIDAAAPVLDRRAKGIGGLLRRG